MAKESIAAETYNDCLASKAEANEYIKNSRNDCESSEGSFQYKISALLPVCNSPVGSFQNRYGVLIGCNTCSSMGTQLALRIAEELCASECRVSGVKCRFIDWDWGSVLDYSNAAGYESVNGFCGRKDYSLPGCAESSSSETVESSSSEFTESSSSEKIDSSSSEDENSSSSDGEECGTGTGHCPVSSSGSGKINSSSGAHGSGIGEQGTQCYIGDEESCGPWSGIILFKKRPVVLGEIRLYGQKPYCREDGNIVFRAGVPIAYFRAASWLCLKEGCISNHSIEGFWECNEGSVQNNGCAAEPEHRSQSFYYSVQTGNLIASWGLKVDFSSTPESGMNLAYFDVNDLLNIVAREGVYVDGDDGLSYDLTDLYPQFSGNSFDNYVRACAYHLNIDVSSSSEVGSSSSSSSLFVLSSSSSVQSSSSEESSSSVGESSSSENLSSSVEMEFSSSVEIGESSSSQEEFSSSSDEIEISSSVDVEESSSSLQIESSSSDFVDSSNSDGCFVPGGDQVHSPNQIFSDCLDNMEPGKCYSINPDRGTQYGWMNTDAQDSWWWREVDCETGEKVDINRVGACPGFPLDSVPDNPKGTCVAYNGKCYRCKSENSYVDCYQEWLWKWSFSEDNIGLWYAEVDCYNPFGEHDNQCPDGNALMKRAVNYSNVENIDNYEHGVNFQNNVKYYDVLGRKTSMANSAKQILYRKAIDKFYQKSTNQLQQTIENIFEGINQRNSRRALFKRDDCGHLRGDYGIIENGQKVGGITCPDAGPLFSTPNVLDNKFLEETCIVKDCEYKKVWVRVGTTLQMSLTSIDYYVVDVGFVFPDGYVTTQKDHNAVEKHEKGHVEDFKCIVKKFPEETKYIEVEVEACNEKDALNAAITESVQPYLDEMKKEYDKRFKRATDRYHQKYDSFKYPEDNYVCPSDL